MSHDEFRKTLEDIYKHNGYEGVVRYFSEHKGMKRDEAEGAANAWGYNEESLKINIEGRDIEMVEHVITQEDLDNNPELIGEGVQIGETIQLPVVNITDEEMEVIKEDIKQKQPSLFQKIFGIK